MNLPELDLVGTAREEGVEASVGRVGGGRKSTRIVTREIPIPAARELVVALLVDTGQGEAVPIEEAETDTPSRGIVIRVGTGRGKGIARIAVGDIGRLDRAVVAGEAGALGIEMLIAE